MSDYSSDHQRVSPSTYTATLHRDQMIIERHEYNALLERLVRLEIAKEENTALKGEIRMLKKIMAKMMAHYGVTEETTPLAGASKNMNENTRVAATVSKKKKNDGRINRRDSGLDGIEDDEEDQGQSRPSGRTRDKINFPLPKLSKGRLAEDLLDLDEEEDSTGAYKNSPVPKSTASTVSDADRPLPFASQKGYRPLEASVTPLIAQPTDPIGKKLKKVKKTKTSGAEQEADQEPEREQEPEKPNKRELESWELPPPEPTMNFELDDGWKGSSDWNSQTPTASSPKGLSASSTAKTTSVEPEPPKTPAWKPKWAQIAVAPPVMDTERPSSPLLGPTSSRTARQLFLEKQAASAAMRALAAAANEAASVTSAENDNVADMSTWRHIYIPNLPPDTTIATLTSIIRTNGKGGIESISMFRQNPAIQDINTYEVPGNGENIGANITFLTAAACHTWFTHLRKNSSPKLQRSPEKTWMFPNEDCAAAWKKCVVLRRADYHPSIADKIDKGGPGNKENIKEAMSKGLRRIILVRNLPANITETELARLVIPPKSRSLTYEGPSHKASGQAAHTTEEFARWKWVERIIIEDDKGSGFGEAIGGSDGIKKKAKIYCCSVKTAFLARGKIWKNFNRHGDIYGEKGLDSVKIEFAADECEGPLSEVPNWVGVMGDDDSDEEVTFE